MMATSEIQPTPNFDLNLEANNSVLLNSKILKPLDDALRCHICFDYFTNCMITKCSHNYCSVCIRRYMAYKSQCPTCFKDTAEPELQNNRLIDEILRIYMKIRQTLQIPQENIKDFIPQQPSSSQSYTSENVEKPLKIEAPSCHSDGKENTDVVQENAPSDGVSCPVCYNTVSNERINIHLDACLKLTEERKDRKYLPKLVYRLISDKDLKKKLREYGLSTSGNRETLIKRLKNFIILFNANSDSLNPKPVYELLIEIERQELEERVNSSQRNIRVNRNSAASEIEIEHESYVRKHQSQFSALIQDIQQRAVGSSEIKEEPNKSQESVSSNIVDESGNIIGESSLRVGSASDIATVNIKQEGGDSDCEELCLNRNLQKSDSVTEVISEKEKNSDKIPIVVLSDSVETKAAPTVKMKEESPSLLENLSKHELKCADCPSSIDDFEVGKIPTQMFRKRKNIQRRSEKGNQRKK